MNRKEFDKWANETYEKFCCDNNVQATFFDEQITTTIVYHFKKRKIGISRCHPDDKFNREIGIAIAYARCKGIEVPKITTYKKLSEMKNGDRFYMDGAEHFFVGKTNTLVRGREFYAIINIKEDTIFRFGNSNNVYEMVE